LEIIMRFQPRFTAFLCAFMSLTGCDCGGGNGNVEDLNVAAELIDFGVVIAGSECIREVTLSNGGAELVTFTGYTISEGETSFAVGDGAPSNLGAGMARPVSVVYSPVTAGDADEGQLDISFEVSSKPATRNVIVKGYAVAQRAPRIDQRCEDAAGEAGVYGPCPALTIDNIQAGQVGAARLKLHNLGSEVLHITRIAVESDSGRWTLERASFEPPNELEQVVVIPGADGDAPIAVRNVVTGDCSLEESGDPDVPLNIDISYLAREVGVGQATLVIWSDDPFQPELRLPLTGVGNGRKGEVSPRFLRAEGDTSSVTIRSLGNTPFPINAVFLDLDMDGIKGDDDIGCRPGERSEDEGAFTCSSPRGAGFQLEPFDGAEGGRDEAEVTVYHWGATPPRSQLVFKSNTLSVGDAGGPAGFFIVPIGDSSSPTLTASVTAALSFVEADGLYSGSTSLTLSHSGSADIEIASWGILTNGGAVAADDSWLVIATSLVDSEGAEVSFPLTLSSGETVLTLGLNGSSGSTWPESISYVLYHDGVAARPLGFDLSLVQPQ
jgi:hypothetical protein